MRKSARKDDDPLAEDRSADIATLQFQRLDLHFVPKDATMTIRLPQSVIAGAKKVAKRRKVKYQALLREAIVDFLVKEGAL